MRHLKLIASTIFKLERSFAFARPSKPVMKCTPQNNGQFQIKDAKSSSMISFTGAEQSPVQESACLH